MKKIYTNKNGIKKIEIGFFKFIKIITGTLLVVYMIASIFTDIDESIYMELLDAKNVILFVIAIGFEIVCNGKDEFIKIKWGKKTTQ